MYPRFYYRLYRRFWRWGVDRMEHGRTWINLGPFAFVYSHNR